MTRRELEALLGDPEPAILQRAGVSPTVDGRLAKTFRQPRGLLSSARLRPYAVRFARAAAELARRGVPTVEVTGLYRLEAPGRDVVVYQPLAGTPLRERVGDDADAADRAALLERFAAFVAELHRRGIAFPGMHLGNVLVLADGSFGLIDIASLRWRRRMDEPVPPRTRARDLRPMLHYEPDRTAVVSFGVERFVCAYLAAAALGDRREARFLRALRRQHPLLAEAGLTKGAESET